MPPNEEANLIFQQGLDAFEEGNYGMAYRRFRIAYRDYALNPKTTAALLMAGKALYREGRYADAVAVLQQLVDGYATSGYLGEAERVLGFAEGQLERGDQEERVLQLGLVLPTSGDNAYLTQAMFNGIRLAAEQHNEEGGRSVRMVFRDTGANPDGARRAVSELSGAGADVIVGPLFSEEAEAAGAAAEAAGVALVAPMATEEYVSEGRRHVFQANPTIPMRGRIMARFAMDELELRDFGVAAQYGNALSEQMAEGFQQAVDEAGARVRFFQLMEGTQAWTALPDSVGADQLEAVEGLYVPVSGSDAVGVVRSLLEGLDGVSTGARLLGNSEWHDRAVTDQASRYLTTYTNDFYVDSARPEVQTFVGAYRELAGETPDALTVNAERLAYTGYDIAAFVLGALAGADDDASPREALRAADLYEGLGVRIDFDESNVNRAMFFFRYYDGQIERIR